MIILWARKEIDGLRRLQYMGFEQPKDQVSFHLHLEAWKFAASIVLAPRPAVAFLAR